MGTPLGAQVGRLRGRVRDASRSPEGRFLRGTEGAPKGHAKGASSSAGAAWEPDFQFFSFQHP